jgi:hypothetical protein
VFSNLFSITLPNIGKYFSGIYFLKENYFQQTNGAKGKTLCRLYSEDEEDLLLLLLLLLEMHS